MKNFFDVMNSVPGRKTVDRIKAVHGGGFDVYFRSSITKEFYCVYFDEFGFSGKPNTYSMFICDKNRYYYLVNN